MFSWVGGHYGISDYRDDRIIRIDSAEDPRYALISPLWRVVEVLVAIVCKLARPSGPAFLNQDRSIRWLAIFCPVFNRLMELRRWVRGLK